MLKQLITLLTISCLSVYASINITPFTGEDNYFYYNVDVVLEDDQYVEGFVGAPSTDGLSRTYYEWIYITPHEAAPDYSFINLSSSLQGAEGSTTDTQLLLYDADTVDLTRVILDGPQIFNSSATFGFGGGQQFQTDGPGLGDTSSEGPFTASLALEEEQYLMVVSSFQPDAFGSMNIEIHGPNQITFASVPEPSTYALMFAFGTFIYVAIRRRRYA